MGDLPGMTIEVAQHGRVAAVEGLGRLATDLRPVRAGLFGDLVHLLGGADVVCESDATPACTVIRDPGVLRELLASPQHENHAIRFEEDRFLGVPLWRPANGLV